ncbi:MAG: CcoQ/FixQ family Cbb3-type cytochrome c oxidase assembly chaperone [Pseudomonadaceae bacterium]|nr:CcoQ/FixQ family Cbb3-type cytochrome c oxidase assembly chaperone [Pseudomonadaceae bacterium]
MSGTLFSLISVVVAFSALLFWVYAPSRKARWNDSAHLPFADQDQRQSGRVDASKGESS